MAKFDLYQTVTDTIIAAIEKGGTLPWVKPWKAGDVPRNGVSNRAYTGVNAILLTIAGMHYGSQEWFTYNNATKLGGNVRKGEKGTAIVFWKFLEKEDANGTVSKFPLLRYFRVFNREQCENLPTREKISEEFDSIDAADEFIRNTGADISHGGDRAFYMPSTDAIRLPHPESFTDATSYYATAFHELVHWTGHASRLDRKLCTAFGTEAYAEEELVAELGAAFLCAELGITGKTQHPEYIANWLTALRNDKRFIFRASGAASKAAAFLTGSPETEEAEE